MTTCSDRATPERQPGSWRTPNVSEGVICHPVAHAPGSPGNGCRSGFAWLLLLLAGCGPKPTDTGAKTAVQEPVPVTVAKLDPVTLNRTVAVSGTLDPYKDVTLAPKVDGRVVRVSRDKGDVVLPGDVLVELECRDYELDVAVARATLAAELEKIKLAEGDLSDRAFDIAGVDAVVKAKADLELTKKELARVKKLRESGVGSAQDLDSAETKVEVAAATLRLTETEARVTLANARRLKSTLELAERRLADTVVKVPVPDEWGVWAATVGPGFIPLRYTVAARMVWEGEMVRAMPEKNVFRLVIDHVLKLRAEVPEKYLLDVQVGQPVEVRPDSIPDKVLSGVVTRIGSTVDTRNRTFEVEIAVPNGNPKFKLKSGGFARADIRTRTDGGVIAVPPQSLVTFAGVTKVFLVDGDRAKAVEVKVGQRDRDWVEVIGPVPAGATVITSGFAQLVDGSPIRVRDAVK